MDKDGKENGMNPYVTIEFDISDVEQEKKLQRMLSTDELLISLWDIEQYLRKIAKYDDHSDKSTEEVIDMIQKEVLFIIYDSHPRVSALMQEFL